MYVHQMCTHAWSPLRPKRMLDAPGLELEMIISHHVGARFSGRGSALLTTEPSLQLYSGLLGKSKGSLGYIFSKHQKERREKGEERKERGRGREGRERELEGEHEREHSRETRMVPVSKSSPQNPGVNLP